MKNRSPLFVLLAVLLSSLLCGCSILNDQIEKYSSNKEKCLLNSNNVTQFTYKEKNYTILEDTVTKNDCGSWVGYIRKLVVVDAKGKILRQQDTEKTTFKTLADIGDKEPNAFAIIPFLNVYESKENTENGLIVEVNGGYHKVIHTETVKNSDRVFKYSNKQSKASNGNFKVNSKNCTQLVNGDKVYQITDKTVTDEQIGEYLDVIAQSIVFDKETKLEIKDPLKIDWSGKGDSKQQRERWTYEGVYAIKNVDVSNSVVVKINYKYRLATCQ